MWIYDPDVQPGKCRGCLASIRWATTDKFAKVPLDENFEVISEATDVNGVPIHQVDVKFSHFVTCPMRDRFNSTARKRAA
jgi:hypothetical protein